MNNLPQEGDVIDGTYKIESLLGKGGFGAVYLARQLNMDRDVALKLLVASGPKFTEMVKRFRREVMAIRNLTHPNTVRIYDFRDNPEGLLYYTMEALKGWTLKDEVQKRGALSPRRLRHVMQQVLKSLSEAHSYNIIHRDLKPANIMLVEMHGETDFVKVLDFGIAKLLQDDPEEEIEELTSAGILVGTLRYMAPEQITGAPLGPQTDLYALGLIAVEMLTGESIFSGTGRWEVFQAQISNEPVAVAQEVQACGLGPVIMRCLQKDVSVRFRSADEVLAALEAIDPRELSEEPLFYRDGDQWVSARSFQTVPMRAVGPILEVGEEDPTVALPTPGLDEGKTVMTAAPALPPPLLRGGGAGGAPVAAGVVSGKEVGGQVGGEQIGRQDIAGLADHSAGASPSMVASEESSKVPFFIGGVVVVALLAGAGFWFVQSGEEAPAGGGEPMMVAADRVVVARDLEEEAGAEVVSGEDAAAGEEEYESYVITVSSGDVRATGFVDGELRGRTPLSIRMLDEEATLRLEAKGYEPLEVVLNQETPGQLELELIPEEEPAGGALGRGSSGRREVSPSAPASAGRASDELQEPRRAQGREERQEERRGSSGSKAKRAQEPVKEESPSRSSDWVEIGSPAPAKEKEKERERREIPLF